MPSSQPRTKCVLKSSTGRCVLSDVENHTSDHCVYSSTTKRCRKTEKKAPKAKTEKKAPKAPKAKTEKKASKAPKATTEKKSSKKSPSPIKIQLDDPDIDSPPVYNEVFGINLSPEAMSYIQTRILDADALEMRQLAEFNELYIPLEKYENDDVMRDYVATEVLTLATNMVRDKHNSEMPSDPTKRKAHIEMRKKLPVELHHIKRVIENDDELNCIINGKCV